MNTYQQLAASLEKNQYKRGQFKGDAPADPSRRGRSHIRIVKGAHTQDYNSVMSVRMYATDILKAFPDGTIEINLRGWESSSTTRANLNDVLGTYRRGQRRLYLSTAHVFGISQPSIYTNDKAYLYYGGMQFDAEGKLMTPPMAFEARRLDRDEAKEFTDDLKESSFKDMFPLLYATCTADEYRMFTPTPRELRAILTDKDCADDWSELIAAFKYVSGWGHDRRRFYGRSTYERGDAKSCWAAIMKRAKEDMHVTLRSTLTEYHTNVAPKFFPATPASK